MSKKLKLNPAVSYMLGLYNYNKSAAIGLTTDNAEVLQKFVKLVMEQFEILPNKIIIEQEDELMQAYFYNSKLKKLLDAALERKGKIFKYKNDYSANYFAGIFDVIGGKDKMGLYLRGLQTSDYILLENIGIHTSADGNKYHITSGNTFVSFIKKFSVKLGGIIH